MLAVHGVPCERSVFEFVERDIESEDGYLNHYFRDVVDGEGLLYRSSVHVVDFTTRKISREQENVRVHRHTGENHRRAQ